LRAEEPVGPPTPAGRDARRLSFGPAAASYDRVRPSYPPQAVRWALGDAPLLVVDLGAGTGLLTRVLVKLGHDVIAVDPDPAMLARLKATAPGVRAIAAAAESLPLPDASVGAVVAGQSYHWFDPARAHPEIARVLLPDGTFTAIWNNRDESVDWVRELWSVFAPDESTRGNALWQHGLGPLFQPLTGAEFRHERAYEPPDLLELVRSRSAYLTAPADRRARMEAAVTEILATHPALRGRTTIALPYVTEVFSARKANG
jgi:SAM-dependent methyltransferase